MISQAISDHDAAVSEYFAAARDASLRGAVIRVTPLDIAGLAETRRTDPELAIRIAEQSAKQNIGDMK